MDINMNRKHTAEVIAMVAEVRVLKVGGKSLTKTMFAQLDQEARPHEDFEIMGRVRTPNTQGYPTQWYIGRRFADNSLVRCSYFYENGYDSHNSFLDLPLIILSAL